MRSLWKFFIDKNHFTILLVIVLFLAGIYAVLIIPKESSPEVQIPYGIVTTVLPGASAEDVERLVTDKIEDRVIGIENVSKVTSSSGDGISSVTVEFDASADIDKSIQSLRDEVAKVNDLPADAEDPAVSDINFADMPILIVSLAGTLEPAELTALGESVEDELERVAGVSGVSVSGVQSRQVQVIVDQAKLEQYGLSLNDVTNAIRASGLASPVGAITVDDIEYGIRLEAAVTDPEEVRGIAISGPGGAVLHVGDVANVIDGLEDPSTFSRVSVAGAPSEPALTLAIYKSRGGNIITVSNDVQEKLEELKETSLSGIDTVISYDAAKEVRTDLTELTRVGLETIVLVMIILFITIGWRESLVAAASIPLSFLIAFIGLAAAGNTLNFISLFSLILAIGILVDSGIVVVEAIHTRLGTLGDKRQAALLAIHEYAWPLVAGTFTTVAVFVPLFFLSGIVGQFISSIPFTVIFVLVASIFVALGIIPLAAMYFVKEGGGGRLKERQEYYNDRARHWYEGYLRGMLEDSRRQKRFIWGMIGLLVISIFLPVVGAVKVVFFPTENADFVYVDISTPHGTNLRTTDLAVREVEEILYEDPDIASFVTDVGSGSEFGSSAGSRGGNIANITVNIVEERTDETDDVITGLKERLAKVTAAQVQVSAPAAGPPTGAAISVTFTGDDRAKLADAVNQAQQVLRDIPGVGDITASTKDDSAEFVVELDAAKAVAAGVSPAAVADTLRTAVYGAKATDIHTDTDDIEVYVKLDLNPAYTDPSQTNDVTIEAIRALTVQGTQGRVPLSSIAAISYEAANTTIRHEDGNRIATIQGTLAPGGNAYAITSEFQKRMAQADLPDGITMKIGGETEDVNKSFAEMGIALLAGIALMLAILVLEFNSFRLSFYLLSIIPLSLIGVLFGLMLTGQPLSFPSMLGIIALAGVIINHAIILMDSIARIGRERPDQSLADVVVEASATRFRPIVLTTVTTVIGMIPLSLASALWGPLAFTIMFGLAFSMTLTLVLIPILYYRAPRASREAMQHSRVHEEDGE